MLSEFYCWKNITLFFKETGLPYTNRYKLEVDNCEAYKTISYHLLKVVENDNLTYNAHKETYIFCFSKFIGCAVFFFIKKVIKTNFTKKYMSHIGDTQIEDRITVTKNNQALKTLQILIQH